MKNPEFVNTGDFLTLLLTDDLFMNDEIMMIDEVLTFFAAAT
jgi:hypothetical protein